MCEKDDRIKELEREIEQVKKVSHERELKIEREREEFEHQKEELEKTQADMYKTLSEAYKFNAEERKLYSEANNLSNQMQWRPWQVALIPISLGILALVAAIAK